MDNKETWHRIEYNDDIPHSYGCDAIIDNVDGLSLIYYCEQDKKVTIVFDNFVYALRKSIESATMETISYLHKNYTSIFPKYWIFEVRNSRYLEWLKKESKDLYTKETMRHFAFFTEQELIEVLSEIPPKIIIEDCPKPKRYQEDDFMF